jgi:membrane protease YdiL (CAAX protease family)
MGSPGRVCGRRPLGGGAAAGTAGYHPRPVSWLEHPALKWLLPLPVLALLAWPIWRVFRATWSDLEVEAQARRQGRSGALDGRVPAAAAIGAVVLALQDYTGRAAFFHEAVRQPLAALFASASGAPLDLERWGDLLRHAWWGTTRIGGYLLPLLIWRALFPADRPRDLGLRIAGFRQHLWIYALCVALMVPVLLVAQRQPDFGAYYPFYRQAGRSWADFLAWEAVYLTQFFALELFFRGWWLRAWRSLGAGAVFAVAVPYVMIHLSKPYLESMGALVAGVVLGSLAVRTRSIWAGVLVHATVAFLMDAASLRARGELPVALWPGSDRMLAFRLWGALPWLAFGAALLVLLLEPGRRARAARGGAAAARPGSG